ncbi:ferrochelatase [Corynebacterium sp. HS2168-gen11]|uniref:ferrochelatase n=1 Tax=Corynebacterium sp. HS2168-gen11 TaxID=2974027 RepID=UPI00216B1B7D|nr:ferrochelatase [Corynebacterium sp. HS2168-gen11]MCS4535108.1 ferrochelatase [Corynebacterium sp. HS2168-gen11]
MNAPIDAVLVLSFGAPEKSEDVMPFLRNVTRGRGIPDHRLAEVAEHYHHFDGFSPLNACNQEIIRNVEHALRSNNIDLPVYFGNRNWHPFASDTITTIAQAGHKHVAVFATSAWGGFSGCKQYQDDIVHMREHLATSSYPAIRFTRLAQFFNHPIFIHANANAIRARYAEFAAEGVANKDIRLVFTAHSIPVVADHHSGTADEGPLYSSQVTEACRLVAEELGLTNYDLVWQSASGDGKVPWLDPDIVDYAKAQAAQGVKYLLVSPIGFISDHMEVIWDLDNELQDEATALGMHVKRAATVGHMPEFADMILELLLAAGEHNTPRSLGTMPVKGCTVNGEPCAPSCCQPAKRPHSATA